MIYIEVPSVPISVNHAYAKKRGGGRILTPEGKAYKNETKTHIARAYPGALKFFEANVPYALVIEFTFHGRDEIMTKTWPEKTKSRYKKLDVTNRTKLFEDALAAATGLDDCQNFTVTVAKAWHRDYEMTRMWAWNREAERSPVDELIQRLKADEAQSH